MTNERNFQDCLLDELTTVLDDLANEHCVDDFGLMEALSVDMLSEEETRVFAEHLETCDYCRRECETMFETGAYEGTPFDERLKRYASETDVAWKKIAEAFNPALATSVEETSKISLDENVPRSRTQVDSVAKSRAFGRQWGLCASAAIVGAVVATSLDFFSNSEAPGRIAEQARVIEEQARWIEALKAELDGAKGVKKGETESKSNENVWTPDAEMLRLNFSLEEAETALAQMEARRGGEADSLASLVANLDELKLVEAVYRGALAFKEGRFDEAAAAFKTATTFKTADEDALWNLAVATAKSGDVEAARKIFESLRDATTSEETRAQVERALNYWRLDDEK